LHYPSIGIQHSFAAIIFKKLIGVTAIPFAYFLWKGFGSSKYDLVVWNVLGIADLVVAVSLGLITSPGFGISTVSTFPWILVPTLGVPLALAVHGITFYRLGNIYRIPTRQINKKVAAR
jgi:hypothetical protein